MLTVDIVKRLSSYDLHIRLTSDDGVLGLFGASGAGKSMTLKCIAGIEKPDSGVIILNDRVLFDSRKKINLKPQQRGVGYLFQDYALFPNMTVRGNVTAALHRLPRADRPAAAQRLMEQFRVDHLASKRPDSISGGERQRTALARLFASDPELILLDEPFSSLDTGLKCELIPLMKDAIAAYGRGCLMVSHDAAELAAICTRVATVSGGENSAPVAVGEFTDEIYRKYEALGILPVAYRRES